MKPTKLETAGWRAEGAAMCRAGYTTSPARSSPGPVTCNQPSGGKILGDRKAIGQRGAPTRDLLQRGGIALEDPLGPESLPRNMVAIHPSTLPADGPNIHCQTQQRGHVEYLRPVGYGRDDDDLILQRAVERSSRRQPIELSLAGPIDVDGRASRLLAEPAGVGCTLNPDRKVVGPRRRKLDQPGAACSAKALRRRCAATDARGRPGDLDRGLLLQAQDFDRAAGQPQPAGRNASPAPVLVNSGPSTSLQRRDVHGDSGARSAAAARYHSRRTTAE